MNVSLSWRLIFSFLAWPARGRQSYLGKHNVEAQIAKKPLMPRLAPGYTCATVFKYL